MSILIILIILFFTVIYIKKSNERKKYSELISKYSECKNFDEAIEWFCDKNVNIQDKNAKTKLSEYIVKINYIRDKYIETHSYDRTLDDAYRFYNIKDEIFYSVLKNKVLCVKNALDNQGEASFEGDIKVSIDKNGTTDFSKKDKEKISNKKLYKQNKKQGVVSCPKCGSQSITTTNKKISVGKGAVGAAVGSLVNPVGTVVGAAVGATHSKKIYNVCMNCGHKWKP